MTIATEIATEIAAEISGASAGAAVPMVGWSYNDVLKESIANDLGVSFNADYTKMFSFDASTDDLAEHTMDANDITSISLVDTTSPGGSWNLIHNRLNAAGTKLLGMHGYNMFQFPLSGAFDASTIGAWDASWSPSEGGNQAWCFNTAQDKIFMTDPDGVVYRYDIATDGTITSAPVFDTGESFDLQSLVVESFANVFTMQMSTDEKYLVLTRNDSKVDTYELTTAGVLSDGVTLVQTADISSIIVFGNSIRGAWLDDANKKFYVMHSGNGTLYEVDYTG